MADSTQSDLHSLVKAAGALRDLLKDMSAFDNLGPHWPNAGRFDRAIWLEEIVDDRRNAIVTQGHHLREAFGQLANSLETVGKKFDRIDADNSDEIKKTLARAEDNAANAMDSYDEKTEQEQGNFHTGKDGEDWTDGDGYNKDLNIPIGAKGDGSDDSGGDDGGGDGGKGKGKDGDGGDGGGGDDGDSKGKGKGKYPGTAGGDTSNSGKYGQPKTG